MDIKETGLLQIYTGDGKGKTTAALGLAFRAIGHGFKVCMIQFLKGTSYTGELFAAQRLFPSFKIYQFGRDCRYAPLIRDGFMSCTNCGECFLTGEEEAKMALKVAKDVIDSGEYSIVILDEVSHAIRHGFIETTQLLEIVHEGVELVMTGRDFPKELLDKADLVTEMHMVKHPFEKGIKSRRGIEY